MVLDTHQDVTESGQGLLDNRGRKDAILSTRRIQVKTWNCRWAAKSAAS